MRQMEREQVEQARLLDSGWLNRETERVCGVSEMGWDKDSMRQQETLDEGEWVKQKGALSVLNSALLSGISLTTCNQIFQSW